MTKVCNDAHKSEGVVFLLFSNVLETGFTSFHTYVTGRPRPPRLIAFK